MKTDLCEGAFQRTEHDQSFNACQSFMIKVKVVKDFPFYVLFRKVVYIWVGLPDFRGTDGKFGTKRECPILSRPSKGIQPRIP